MNVIIPSQERVINTYGKTAQTVIHLEEMGELIQAISKMHRFSNGEQTEYNGAGYKAYCNLVEEIGDVLISIRQIQEIYNITDAELQQTINAKCKRMEDRIDAAE